MIMSFNKRSTGSLAADICTKNFQKIMGQLLLTISQNI